ncbi:MAG: hypothetical protein V4501_10675 [Pseudomonadota bacterium]
MINTLKNSFSKIFLLVLLSTVIHAEPAADKSTSSITIDTRSFFEQLISSRPQVSPSSSVSTPIAYGLSWRTVVFGVTGQNGTQYTHRPFGQYAVGFGLGDPDKFVSLTTIATMGGLDEVNRDGNVNFQLSRNLNSTGLAMAFGVENVAPWGADKRNKMNTYCVVSRITTLQITKHFPVHVVTSLGLGNSRFVHNYEVHQNEVGIFRPFGSIGIQILPQAAIMLDYVGLTYNAGISIVPFLRIPLVMSLTATDLTNRGGSHIPIAGSIGYSYTF